jgi:exosortase
LRRLLLVFAPLAVAHVVTWRWIWDSWWLPDSYFSHGALVPLVFLAVVAAWRERWRAAPLQADRRGWLLLAPGLLLHLAGAALIIDSLSAASLLLAVPGACWLALGAPRTRVLAPALGLLVFAIPWPMFVTGRAAFELKEWAIAAGTAVANAFGAGVVRDGAFLRVPGDAQPLLVADPCSGLRSLLALTTLGYCVAFFLGPLRGLRPWLILAAAAPIAFATNALRIAAICLVSRGAGVAWATGPGHDLINAGEWVLDLLLLLALDRLLRGARPPAAAPMALAPAPAAAAAGAGRTLAGAAVVLWLLAPWLLALALYRPFSDSRGRAARLPPSIGGLALQQELPLTAREHYLLGTSDATWRRYAPGAAGGPLWLVAVFGTSWKSLHPPHICIEGTGMTIHADGTTEVAWRDGRVRVGRMLARTRGDARDYLGLYAFAGADFVTASTLQLLARLAPRALVRARTDACLLRVETFVEDGDEQAAEARARAFLEALLPVAQEALR